MISHFSPRVLHRLAPNSPVGTDMPPSQGCLVGGVILPAGPELTCMVPGLSSATHAHTAGTAAITSHWATRLCPYALLLLVTDHVGMLPWHLSRRPLSVHTQP